MNEATIAKKQQEVQVVVDKINEAGSTVFVDYLGLTVAEVTELRKKLHAENCEMKVVKNNILRRASSQAGYSAVDEHLVGPSALVTSKDEVMLSSDVEGLFEILKVDTKIENTDYRKYKTICVCKCCGKQITI